jgi:hypothetical protein
MVPSLIEFPLETSQKFLEEFARREAREDSKIIQKKTYGKSTSTLSSA